jgi:hypothetical protein
MLKKILICALGLLVTIPLMGCPVAEAHPTDKDWSPTSGPRDQEFDLAMYTLTNLINLMQMAKESKLSSPHMFTMGFELQQCMPGGKWLDVLFIQNVSVTGLDQSVISPSARVLGWF